MGKVETVDYWLSVYLYFLVPEKVPKAGINPPVFRDASTPVLANLY